MFGAVNLGTERFMQIETSCKVKCHQYRRLYFIENRENFFFFF